MTPFALVLGCERSGTSAVARVLHELGFCMGHDFPPADKDNPEGYFEDRSMRTPSFRFAANSINGEAWLQSLEQAHAPFRCEAPGWGVKHPALSNASPWAIKRLEPVLLVITTRKLELVVASLSKAKFELGTAAAQELWKRRTQGVVRIVRSIGDDIPTKVLIMDRRLADHEIRAGVEEALS